MQPLRHMLFIDGGIARLIEHCVEQYHQVVRCYDSSYSQARSLEKQAEVRSKLERRGHHPCVRVTKKRPNDAKKKRQHRHERQQSGQQSNKKSARRHWKR